MKVQRRKHDRSSAKMAEKLVQQYNRENLVWGIMMALSDMKLKVLMPNGDT